MKFSSKQKSSFALSFFLLSEKTVNSGTDEYLET